jgi:excisionase family DNA binding protein
MSNTVVPITPRAREAPSLRDDRTIGRDVNSLPMLLAVSDVAKLLGISRSAAYRLADSGELPSRRLGGRVYIITAKLFEMLEAA